MRPVPNALLLLATMIGMAVSCFATEWIHSFPFRWGNPAGLIFIDGRFSLQRSLNFGFSSVDGAAWTSYNDARWWGGPVYPKRIVAVNGQAFGFESQSLYRSRDGMAWSQEAMPLECAFEDLSWGIGMFAGVVACGDGRAVATSLDGIQWTKHKHALQGAFNRIAYGNNAFVMLDMGSIACSPDAVNWTLVHTTAETDPSKGLTEVAYGNGKFVAVGNNGIVAVSSDGKVWAESTMTGGIEWKAVVFGGSRFVAVTRLGAAYASTDGLTWQGNATNVRDAAHIAYGDGRYVIAGGDGDAAFSEDGIAWTHVPHKAGILNAAAHAKGYFAAVGDTGVIATSPDGERWTERRSGVSKRLKGIAWGNDAAVAVGDSGTILTSPDLVNWISRDGGTAANVEAIVFAESVFVATTSSSAGGGILTSSDGITWTTTYASQTDGKIPKVAYGDGLFMAISAATAGTWLTSPDGRAWTRRQSATVNRFFNTFLTHGKAGFFFGADLVDDTIFLSKDGLTVEPVRVPARDHNAARSYSVRSMDYGHGHYVGVKNHTRNAIYSSDGRSWQKDSSDYSEPCTIHFLDGKWLKLCSDKTTSITAGFDALAVTARQSRAGFVPRAMRLPPEGFFLPPAMKGLSIGLEIFDSFGRMRMSEDILVTHIPFRIITPDPQGAYFARLKMPPDGASPAQNPRKHISFPEE